MENLGYHKLCARNIQWTTVFMPSPKIRRGSVFSHCYLGRDADVLHQFRKKTAPDAKNIDRSRCLMEDYMERETINYRRRLLRNAEQIETCQPEQTMRETASDVSLITLALPHIFSKTGKIQDFRWKLFEHPPYSPDLAHSDSVPFLNLKRWLGGIRFEGHRVVIVGAGVSGFTAAATLLEHNVTDLVVLEAADRIGGRIHTVEFGKYRKIFHYVGIQRFIHAELPLQRGVTLDEGAEFCHGEVDNAVYELIGTHNLLTSYLPVVRPDKFLYASPSDSSFNATEIVYLLYRARQIFYDEDIQHFEGSVADYYFPRFESLLTSLNVGPHTKEALRHFSPLLQGAYTGADDLSDLGAWGYSQWKECKGDQTLKWKNGAGGYKTLFDFISKKKPNRAEELPVMKKIILNKQVTRVERRGSDVEVTCADGSTYLADHVIVSVSLGVLKKHAVDMFNPPLPEYKTAAIESFGFGCIGKVFILFPNRWWPSNFSSILPLFSNKELLDFKSKSAQGSWSVYTTGFYPVLNHDRMLCAWFHGQACRMLGEKTEEEVSDGVLELLNELVGSKYTIPRPEAVLRTDWASDPNTLGAFSYRTVASDSQNLSNSDLALPVRDENDKPVILFAGEATHNHYYSTVHGALETGRREALRLIDYMKKR
ncbi:hypothetical protein J6590_070153 [Homalodisca vitripennis]|nr:hypothetical protein J6590_070153 [Homalodisca vitripennis]